MEQKEYRIPLRYRFGEFRASQLPHDGETICFRTTSYDFLEYTHPEFGREIRVYHVPADAELLAMYQEDGTLLWISFFEGDRRRYAYFADLPFDGLIDDDIIRMRLAAMQLVGDVPVSRLFFESFFDGEGADFALKIGTQADMDEIRGRYGDDTGAVNNSGEYPSKWRIPCDTDRFRILLLCNQNSGERFRETVSIMTKQITDALVPKLNKAPDFRVMDAEYD